jgi:hypothetical protein
MSHEEEIAQWNSTKLGSILQINGHTNAHLSRSKRFESDIKTPKTHPADFKLQNKIV